MKIDVSKVIEAMQSFRSSMIAIGCEMYKKFSNRQENVKLITCPKCKGKRRYPVIGNMGSGGRIPSQWRRCSLCLGIGIVMTSNKRVIEKYGRTKC
jgi:hypothetical protein